MRAFSSVFVNEGDSEGVDEPEKIVQTAFSVFHA